MNLNHSLTFLVEVTVQHESGDDTWIPLGQVVVPSSESSALVASVVISAEAVRGKAAAHGVRGLEWVIDAVTDRLAEGIEHLDEGVEFDEIEVLLSMDDLLLSLLGPLRELAAEELTAYTEEQDESQATWADLAGWLTTAGFPPLGYEDDPDDDEGDGDEQVA
jgi:hypothetical protein